MKRHPFYGEFFRRFGLASTMACLVERRPHYEVFLSLQRPAGRPLYRAEDAQALDWAVPHVRQAKALRDRALAATTLSQVSAQLLDRMAFGVIVMAQNGKVLFHNGRGEAWIRRLFPSAAQLARSGKSAAWSLSRPVIALVENACRPMSTVPAQAALATGPDGAQAQIVVLPLPPAHLLAAGAAEPLALVTIHEPGRVPPLLSGVLRGLYALTPAEVRLASLLTTGIGLPEACERLNIRRETSRTQLKSIFTKTGTGTQAQLAHLMTQLATSLNAQPEG
jgi:DNA-binding CsgD family transcriptional regulator